MAHKCAVVLAFIYLTLSADAFRVHQEIESHRAVESAKAEIFSARADRALDSMRTTPEAPTKTKMSARAVQDMSALLEAFWRDPSMKIAGTGGKLLVSWVRLASANKAQFAENLAEGFHNLEVLPSRKKGFADFPANEDIYFEGVANVRFLEEGVTKWFDNQVVKHPERTQYKGCAFDSHNIKTQAQAVQNGAKIGEITMEALATAVPHLLQRDGQDGSCGFAEEISTALTQKPLWATQLLRYFNHPSDELELEMDGLPDEEDGASDAPVEQHTQAEPSKPSKTLERQQRFTDWKPTKEGSSLVETSEGEDLDLHNLALEHLLSQFEGMLDGESELGLVGMIFIIAFAALSIFYRSWHLFMSE